MKEAVLRAFTRRSADGTAFRGARRSALSAGGTPPSFRLPVHAVGTTIITTALLLTNSVAAQSVSEATALLSESVMRDPSAPVEDNTAPNALFLRESGVIELTANIPVSALSGEPSDTKDYYIDIGAETSTRTLLLTLDVGTGDPDLYAGQNYPPSADSADCQSVLSSGNNEECKITTLVEGRYYIRVLAYSSYSGAELKATLLSPPAAPTITGITPTNGALEVAFETGSGSADSYQVSCVDPSLRKATDVMAFITEPDTALFSKSVMRDTGVTAGGQTFSSAKAFH